MRSSWKWYVGLATLTAMLIGPALGQGSRDKVSVDADGVALKDVLKILSENTGLNVIPDAEVAQQTVTLCVSDVSIDAALQALAFANRLEVEVQKVGDETLYLVRARGARAQGGSRVSEVGGPSSSTVSLTSGPSSLVRPPGGSAPSAALPTNPSQGGRPHLQATATASGGRTGETIYAKIPLRYVLPSEMADFVNGRSVPSASRFIEGRGYVTTGVDLGVAPYTATPGARISPALERGIRNPDSVIQAVQGRYSDSLRDRYGRLYTGRDQFGDAGGGPGGLGGPGGGGGGLGGPGGGGAGGNQVFARPDGVEEVVGLDMISALIVRGEPSGIEELRELVELLDVPPKQIEVESRFVNLTVSEADALGISWTVTNGTMNVEGATPSNGGASVALEYLNGNAQALLTAIRRENAGKVINAPKVATQNGQPALVAFQQDIPVTLSETVTTDAATQVVTTIETISVTTALLVVPRVTGAPPNESITTYIQPQVEDVIGYVDNPGGGTVPITATQQIQTMLRVPDGGTIALGGLIRKNNSDNTSKIPWLGDLPIIGQLFQSHNVTVDESELIVFVTPTILRDPSANEGPDVVQ